MNVVYAHHACLCSLLIVVVKELLSLVVMDFEYYMEKECKWVELEMSH